MSNGFRPFIYTIQEQKIFFILDGIYRFFGWKNYFNRVLTEDFERCQEDCGLSGKYGVSFYDNV